jgi:hypothetical protein
MTKKNDGLMWLPPVDTPFALDLASAGYLGGSALTTTERQQMKAEVERHLAAMDAALDKGLYAQGLLTDLDMGALEKVRGYFRYAYRIMAEEKGQPYELELAQFIQRMIQEYCKHIFGSVQVAARAIAFEIARSPYPPEGKKNFFQWLFRR